MRDVYPTLLTKTNDDKDTVLIEVPDLGILTEGYGIKDAILMARDAIGMKGIVLEDEGADIPEPSNIEDVDISKSAFLEAGQPIVTLVDIDFAEYRRKVDNKSVRRNVTIPNWLDQDARKAGLNMSKVLQEALKSELGVV